jgi:ribosome recycling factor
MYDFKQFDADLSEVVSWLKKELSSIRTGRATVTLLDSVFVESYGTKMPLNQVASLSQEDPKTLKLNPFDASQSPAIEKAVNEADLGVSVSNSSTGIRVIFPDLTSERRDMLIKQANKKLEEARISVRSKRDDIKKEINNLKQAGTLGEDDERRFEEEMQGKVDAANKELEEMTERKEEEISV